MSKRPSRKTEAPLLEGSILKRQLDLEMQAIRNGVIRYRRLVREVIDRGDGANLKPAERLLLHWLDVMVEAIREERRAIRRGEMSKGRTIYGPALLALDPERAAIVTIHEMLGYTMAEPWGVKVFSVAYSIGRACLAELNHDILRSSKDKRKILKELTHHIRRILPIHINWWAKKNLDDPIWSKRVALHMGTALMWLLLGVASTRDYDDTGSAFQQAFHHIGGGISSRDGAKIIRLDEEAAEIIEAGHLTRQYLRPGYLPMVVRPYPWTDDQQGGYLRLHTPLINRSNQRQQKALEHARITAIYDGLNAVNAAAWRVNTKVRDVVRAVWSSGGGTLDIPNADDHLIPPFDKERITEWKAEAREIHQRNKHLKAERQVFIQRLMVADQMPDRFYLPHNTDFRGRCYPIPPHLTHHGDDLCRGLLEWADAKPVTDPRWLAFQVANCWEHGVDKLAAQKQFDWVADNQDKIEAVAAKPLDVPWWQDAGKPWQFLAACFALAEYPTPSRLPIRQDGTCNGLQHYAALGRSADDAAVVNMIPGDEPNDIYSDVAATVELIVRQAAGEAHQHAMMVDGLIEREVVKQVVMTTFYGVTAIGAKRQIHRQLEKRGLEGDDLYKASYWLSRIVMRCMADTCPATTRIMVWLRQCAQQICITGEPIQWTTPLGLPVVQPYRRWRSKQINTVMQQISAYFDDEDVPIAIGKQCKALAPNYIHSLDASHMLMTAQACHAAGITFAAIHDAYCTHAADCTRLGRILRQQFIQLHTPPLLEQLVRSFRGRYRDDRIKFENPPPRGDYDLNQVMESRYFFS